MKLYGGIDLHGKNSVVVLQDEADEVHLSRRIRNDLQGVLTLLEPYRQYVSGIVVESTYNWYWLVDGLEDHGYQVHLANPAAIQQYKGLKYSDDESDARWLAKMLRLGILPEGHVYPRKQRAVRDLLRKRGQLVRHKTAHLLSIGNLFSRNLGISWRSEQTRTLKPRDVDHLLADPNQAVAVKASLSLVGNLQYWIDEIEKRVSQQMRLRPEYRQLRTVDGIGLVLALTISLETGDIGRFAKVGNYTSYCRCVPSKRLSAGKSKGKGNVKNGNKYLAWAFIEAANYAIRYNDLARRFYQRKKAKRNAVVARKALAHKLARACYYVMRDQVPFDSERTFE